MKYCYRYIICTDNLCYGRMQVSGDFAHRADALQALPEYQNKYGCCDVVKCRVYFSA